MGLNNTPKSWAYNARGEFDLLRAFVTVAERKIEESSSIVKQLVITEQMEFEIEQDDGTVVTHAVDVRNIGNINDIDFDLDSLLGSTFPNYERRSFLITIYGIFEYELDKFCKRYSNYSGVVEGLEKSEKKDRSKIYKNHFWLKKYCSIDLSEAEHALTEIDTIRFIRNSFAHNYGILDMSKSAAVDYVTESNLLHLSGESVFMKTGFLQHFCDLCFQYFSKLEDQARAL
ncbi:hypothetical protein [Marinobacter goseongensis]|uniref:hypothetical protein n=1 Tax=Marinobacter goseongensis TaxID=453838 RepID=UPI002004B78B|nr:hypothetical protein [Marinobacter goseongensis]MCK7553141.1 hypothetical protein [Marinobacter goseongensis]